MDAKDCDLGAFVNVVFKERHGGDGLGEIKDYHYPVTGYLAAKSDLGIFVSFYDPNLESTLPAKINPTKHSNKIFINYANILDFYQLVPQQ
jgi:hypothetical protein